MPHKYIDLKVRKPNEYTTWKPRLERYADGSSSFIFGIFVLGWA